MASCLVLPIGHCRGLYAWKPPANAATTLPPPRLNDNRIGCATANVTDNPTVSPIDAPPTARVKQVSTGQVITGLDSRIVGHSGVFDPITVETAEDIDRATRKRFSEAPAAVVADAKRAKDITIALQVALRDLHLNVPEAGEALDLLDKQADELDNIIAILQSDGDKEAARKTLRDLLYDVLESFLKVLAKSGPTRGILAAAALAALSLTGVEVTNITAALVAGSIIGLDVHAIRKILAGWKKKKDEGQ